MVALGQPLGRRATNDCGRPSAVMPMTGIGCTPSMMFCQCASRARNTRTRRVWHDAIEWLFGGLYPPYFFWRRATIRTALAAWQGMA